MKPTQLELPQGLPGFEQFIGAWLHRGERSVLVDPGPSRSVPPLVEKLAALGLDRLDYVLLTHIHIDHAGGLADFLAHYPAAKVICHAKGIRHLVDPGKLWAGSLKTLGALAQHYGRIGPVAEDRLIPHDQARVEGLTVIETPGHAAHHLSFSWQGRLYVGEAAGNYDTSTGREYLRPATPPVFFLQEFLASVDRLLGTEDQPIHFAHYGEAPSAHRILHRFRGQLLRWEQVIRREVDQGQEDLVSRCVSRLITEDPDMEAFHAMDRDRQERERLFMGNAVRGYLGSLVRQR